MKESKSKTAAPIRHGFNYQDLVALKLALQLYIKNIEFNIFLEYGNQAGLDDILIICGSDIDAYQIKHAENQTSPFLFNDFINKTDKRTNFYKYSQSWKRLRELYPECNIRCHLLSNRSFSNEFVNIIESNGRFNSNFIANKMRKEARAFRNNLRATCKLNNSEFIDFLSSFEFNVNDRSIPELEDYITGFLLDHKLGITDKLVYYDLLSYTAKYAIEYTTPITYKLFDDIFRETENRYLLPQQFIIDQSTFVSISKLKVELDQILLKADAEYVVVTGLPGSGKSTSLSVYLDSLKNIGQFVIVKYFCFVKLNDNAQRRRVEAQSLRINVLNELHRAVPKLLGRRFDFSGDNLDEALETIGNHLSQKKQKLIIFIDGLDHAERETDVLDNTITSLPRSIPKGVIILIGTQELSHWRPIAMQLGRQKNHVEMPLFSSNETREYLEKNALELTPSQIEAIHNNCEGLPLYLKYIVEIIKSGPTEELDFNALLPAEGGQIDNYYRLLWSKFDASGRGLAKHLCATMACLVFKIHLSELIEYQDQIPFADYDEAFSAIKHLLRFEEYEISIFHNSFRIFALSNIGDDIKKHLHTIIKNKLISEKPKTRWLQFVFQYAYNSGDFGYILRELNKDYVDLALKSLRPRDEIIENINWAVEAAIMQKDLVALARIGPLKYRTHERLEHLDSTSLVETLFIRGLKQEAISFMYNYESNKLLISAHAAVEIIPWCAEYGNFELGRKLFDIFTSEYDPESSKDQSFYIKLAYCLGIYGKNKDLNIKWLTQLNFKNDPALGKYDVYSPSYEPHLNAYIKGVVKYGEKKDIELLRNYNNYYSNQIFRFYIIRELFELENSHAFTEDIQKYIKLFPDAKNQQLAVWAAKAGLQPNEYGSILDSFDLPNATAPYRITHTEYGILLQRYYYNALILGYEGSNSVIEMAEKEVYSKRSYWSSLAYFVIKCGTAIGRYYSNNSFSILKDATDAMDCLIKAQHSDGERNIEIHDGFRKYVLREILYDLTKIIFKTQPQLIPNWIDKLVAARDSDVWTVNYGISEYIQNYSFELNTWDRLTDIVGIRHFVLPLIESCKKTYYEEVSLKGETRSDHLLSLASIAAKCGYKDIADELIMEGIKSTNIYGYHKDVTLSHLMDVLDDLNSHKHEGALGRCAKVLELIKWMPSLTDGRETKWFPQEAFSLVLKISRSAAFDLLAYYLRNVGRWTVMDCLLEYINAKKIGDPAFLWALSAIFTTEFQEPGRYAKQVINATKHIADLASLGGNSESARQWHLKYEKRIRTCISPNYWPRDIYDSTLSFERRPPQILDDNNTSANNADQDKLYLIDGKEHNTKEIKEIFNKSFNDLIITYEKLKRENQHYFGDSAFVEAFGFHIRGAKTSDELDDIKTAIESNKYLIHSDLAESAANRYLQFGDIERACYCFELAYHMHNSWRSRKDSRRYLEAIKPYGSDRVINVIINDCHDNLKRPYGGYDTPMVVASALEVLEDYDGIEQVYNDYQTHCDGLFSHLPLDFQYDWLKEYKNDREENHQILELLLNELANIEIDLGIRLSKAILELLIEHDEFVWPYLCSTLGKCDFLSKIRILSIFQSVSIAKPVLLQSEWKTIWEALKRGSILEKMYFSEIMYNSFNGESIPSDLAAILDEIKRNYSSQIYYSSYRPIITTPSSEFNGFIDQGALNDFKRQIHAAAEVLKLDGNSILAELERRLLKSGWSINQAIIEAKADRKGRVHPQGYPFIWIIPRFHSKLIEQFYYLLGEYFEKMKFTELQLNSIWRIIQPSDPEYLLGDIESKPSDIPPLFVKNKDKWLDELQQNTKLIISKSDFTDWVTLFEQRHLSQANKYDTPYISDLSMFSTLIQKDIPNSDNIIEQIAIWYEPLKMGNPLESLTWDQVRSHLASLKDTEYLSDYPSIPIISYRQKYSLFVGHMYIASLSSIIINKYGLILKGFDCFHNGNQITRYQNWQEGYVDDAYSRELLSYGTRLQIKRTFLNTILQDYNIQLCRKIEEKRSYYKYSHKDVPDEEVRRSFIERIVE